MGLLDNLENVAKPKTCRVRTVHLEFEDAKDRQRFIEAVEDTSWAANNLMSSLRNLGVSISSDAIMRHRRKICSCSKI